MEPFFNFLLSVIDKFYPLFVVPASTEAIRLRFGRYVKPYKPGTYFRIPFGIDEIDIEPVKVRTVDLEEISIETSDRIGMACSIALRFSVVDVVQALIETEDYETSMMTDVTGIVSAWINEHDYESLSISTLIKGCQPKIKLMAPRWGCKVEELLVNTLVKHEAHRVMGISF